MKEPTLADRLNLLQFDLETLFHDRHEQYFFRHEV